MKATKIKMKYGCRNSNNLLEIDSIYISDSAENGYHKKETIHDYVRNHPNSIQVNISPYPSLVPAISSKGEKYVKSANNNTTEDNLLRLPRE